MKKMLMGNEAMAFGALRAGVGVVTGYPGTPSTEVLETIAKNKPDGVYVEWSVNEKAALEVAAGAAYAGARSLVTMKQVGLNVASDPLMSLAYVGVKGGMVVLVADDPGPISSQTEQDTRRFAGFAHIPVFDPCSPEEAYLMMAEAFECSEKYSTPVIIRPTTRICHATASIEILPDLKKKTPEGFIKDVSKWVIFPRLSYGAHIRNEERNEKLREDSYSAFNSVSGKGKLGIASGGVSYMYAREALSILGEEPKIFKVAAPHPFPEKAALDFLSGLDEVLVYEELDPVIERELVYICGKYNLNVKIKGKLTHDTPAAGENSCENALSVFSRFLGLDEPEISQIENAPPLPIRPPTLCAGCPHRASFYAVKKAMAGRKALFSGDIGCYTLGNAAPLNMTDTCLCMGAGITIAQGIKHAEPDTVCFSFTGDSTFFHTGMVGIANAVYNGTDMVAVILDNSTTAMTGQQPNPSTGKKATGEVAEVISIERVLSALGVNDLQIADPFDLDSAVDAVKRAADKKGVSAIIFRAPCIAVSKPKAVFTVDKDKCVGCKKCIREIGCPAIVRDGSKVKIDSTLCRGCALCTYVCPCGAFSK